MASRFRTANRPRISFFAFQDIITSVTGILILVTLVLTLYINHPAALWEEFRGAPAELTRQVHETRRQLEAVNAENALRLRLIGAASESPDSRRLNAEIESLRSQTRELEQQLERIKLEASLQQGEAMELARRFGLDAIREKLEEAARQASELQQTNTVLREQMESAREQMEKLVKEKDKLWLIPDASPDARENVLVVVSGQEVTTEKFAQPQSKRTFPAAGAAGAFAATLEGWNPARIHLVFYVKPSGINLFQGLQETARRAGFSVGHDALEEDKKIIFAPPAIEGAPPAQ